MINKNLTAYRNGQFTASFDATGQLWTGLTHTFELNFAKHGTSTNVVSLVGSLDELTMQLSFEMDSEETRALRSGNYLYSVFAVDNTTLQSTLFMQGMLFVEDTIFVVPVPDA